jgi:hypothetical protein
MRTTKTCSLGLRARWSTRAMALGVALLLGGCAKVTVMPLGTMRDGRHQYEVECNELASNNGACHKQALDACGGDYETLDIDNTTPTVASSDGSSSARRYRVLLIACNR